MKYFIISVKSLVYLYLVYLAYIIAFEYDPTSPDFRPPAIIWITDIMNLYIHEAGHFFFKVFGTWVYFLGGSLFQILVPLSLLIVMWRQNRANAGFAGFWLGESMNNVSVYVKDAPYGKLPLIAKGLTHDWHWLLSGSPDLAEPLGGAVSIIGILVCVGSVAALGYFAVRDFSWHDTASKTEN